MKERPTSTIGAINDQIVESLKNLETHTNMLVEIPASEQHIGHIQVAVKAALLDVKKCLEAIVAKMDCQP